MGLGRRERVKDKVRDGGLKALSTVEVLELMLYPFIPRKDTMGIAKDLLARFGGLEQVLDAHPNALMEVPGVTPSAALLISNTKDIVSRATMDRIESDVYLSDYSVVGEYLCAYIGSKPMEHFVALFLNIRGRLLGKKDLSEGNSSETHVDYNAVATTAVNLGAKAVIIAHNHPSGDLSPSSNDIAVTAEMERVLSVLKITLLDHIIVSRSNFVRIKEILAGNDTIEHTRYLSENAPADSEEITESEPATDTDPLAPDEE